MSGEAPSAFSAVTASSALPSVSTDASSAHFGAPEGGLTQPHGQAYTVLRWRKMSGG